MGLLTAIDAYEREPALLREVGELRKAISMLVSAIAGEGGAASVDTLQ